MKNLCVFLAYQKVYVGRISLYCNKSIRSPKVTEVKSSNSLGNKNIFIDIF